jgi:hypothetical protein
LEVARDSPKAGHDDLPGADRASEGELTERDVGRGIFEDTFAGEAGMLRARGIKRQRPALSLVVMSTVSALTVKVLVRRPATVTNAPRPSLSSLRRRSLPFWAVMGEVRK